MSQATMRTRTGLATFWRSHRFRALATTVLGASFAIVITVTVLFPLALMLLSSFKTDEEIEMRPIRWIPKEWQWQNYVHVWNDSPVKQGLMNSVIIGLSRVVGVVSTSTMCGYAFAKLRFPGRDVIFVIILSTLMVPFFLPAIPLFVFFAGKLGWANTYQIQILPFLASAYGIFLMRQFVLTIPTDYIDSGRIDGASEFGILMRIVLPMLKSPAAALAIFTFVSAYNDLFWPMLVATDYAYYPIQMAVLFFRRAYDAQEHYQMAASTIALLPVIIMYLILQERMVQGVTLTGLKG